MKLKIFMLLLIAPLFTFAQVNFSSYFNDYSLRFDFLLGGNSKEVKVYPEQIKMEPYWAGPKTRLTDSFHYGSYRFRIFDLQSDLFSQKDSAHFSRSGKLQQKPNKRIELFTRLPFSLFQRKRLGLK